VRQRYLVVFFVARLFSSHLDERTFPLLLEEGAARKMTIEEMTHIHHGQFANKSKI